MRTAALSLQGGVSLGCRAVTGYSYIMVKGRTVTARQRFAARPVAVVADLDDLQGPTTGIAELPMELFWNLDRRFDLSRPANLRWMYENVLREAARPEELRYLNGDMLVAVWQKLYLPKSVRLAWEDAHPVLRAAAAAPAA
jgi:hypothetical protein